ncbi:MAG: DinB family protein [Bacteroidota bacterium]
MTTLTLPGDSDASTVDRYRRALLDLLGSADPLDVLRTMPSWCADVLRDTPPERLSAAEAPGRWSVAAVLHHLADSEVMWSVRLRRTLAEERPALAGYDQDLWAARLHYEARALGPSVDAFRAMRSVNLLLVEQATEAEWQRVGLHGERGEESVADMVRLYAGHDLAHRAQIERILRADYRKV